MVVFGGAVGRVLGLALALTFEVFLATGERTGERVFAVRFCAGRVLTVVFFLRAGGALAIDFERRFATFFELDFLLLARWVRASGDFLAAERAAFARLAFLLVGTVRWGTCLAALRRTTGTRLLMVSGFQRERLCRGLRANRCLWRHRRNRRAIRYHPFLTDETKCYGYFEQVIGCSGIQ